ncbi:hypothetical protein MXD61_08930 [Frankia sp. AgPm24]|uniref:hypothetical protein n=1 Tax=Frankia sp. AgPm24 TaxID=631128 RepID=UPI00200FBD7A|nr:hypothetical protein [Frankia sp. AgPm24]MCK9922004.1 hypothetical protein [Frankia sp. AgPm24]
MIEVKGWQAAADLRVHQRVAALDAVMDRLVFAAAGMLCPPASRDIAVHSALVDLDQAIAELEAAGITVPPVASGLAAGQQVQTAQLRPLLDTAADALAHLTGAAPTAAALACARAAGYLQLARASLDG